MSATLQNVDDLPLSQNWRETDALPALRLADLGHSRQTLLHELSLRLLD